MTGAHARRAAREVGILAHGHRFQRHLLSDAHPRAVGHAAAHLHLWRGMGWTFLNQFETVCAFILGFAFVVLYINIIKSLINGERGGRGRRPLGWTRLEWATTSPPPPYNFGNIPNVRGRDPFWITKYGRAGSRGVAMLMPLGRFPSRCPRGGGPDRAHPHAGAVVLSDRDRGGPFGHGPRMDRAVGTGWSRSACSRCSSASSEWHSSIRPSGRKRTRPKRKRRQLGGADVRKVGLWSFIGSECLFFATLISTYVVYKSAQDRGLREPRSWKSR